MNPVRKQIGLSVSACLLGILMAGCITKDAADEGQREEGPTAVNVAIARTDTLQAALEYTGTTAPLQEVSLRSRLEGQVLSLTVDVGDAVQQGQIVGQLDDNLLQPALNEALAELASLEAEVASARNQVSNARAALEQARLAQQQAQADSQRQQILVQEGAVAAQAAEQAQTAARTATQAVRAAQDQVATQQQTVSAAQSRVAAQQAAIAQARKQLSYTTLVSPLTGTVTQRLVEPGDVVQPNDEIVSIADFSRVQIDVEVSELELANLQVGQSVRVRLDAFPQQTITGQVTRISPVADQTARLVPIEVVIPNSRGIGAGLLARVSFAADDQQIIVPDTAIVEAEATLVFVVDEAGEEATVAAREVQLGEQANGKVEIVSGLQPGERFVAQSERPLQNGETVRLSILSEVE